MAKDPQTFVIHLARATGRRAQAETLLTATPFRARILDACDGAALGTPERNRIFPGAALFQPRYPFTLSPGEIGCFLSHRAAWQRIVENALPYALILEDDVAIDANPFRAALGLACSHIDDLGYIQFQTRRVSGAMQTLAEANGAQLVRPEITPLRTSAQLVSHAAAQRLLDKTDRIDRPVDAFLQMHWETRVQPCCAVPSGVSDRTAETGGSTISSVKRGLGEKLIREIQRTRYRRKIAALSRGAAHA